MLSYSKTFKYFNMSVLVLHPNLVEGVGSFKKEQTHVS